MPAQISGNPKRTRSPRLPTTCRSMVGFRGEIGDLRFLCLGDGDFRPLIASLQRQGVRVSVVSTIRSQPPMISDDLRRQADNFIELEELKDVIGRPPRPAPASVRDEPVLEDEVD